MEASYPLPDEKGEGVSLQREDSPSFLRWHSPNTAYINYHFPSAEVLQRATHLFCANVMESLKGLLFFPLCLHCSPTKCNLPFLTFYAPPATNIVALKLITSNFKSSHFVFINPTSPDCVLSPLSFPEHHWPCLFLPAYNLMASSSSIQLWKWR